jgi:pantoate--beta-alanine ligase
MRIVRGVGAMQRLAQQWRREGLEIGLVPTMGYLHAGHMSLVARSRKSVGSAGRVVVSIYVNPTQFGPQEDLARYPRDLARDVRLCRTAGVDIIFAPADSAMYPGRAETAHSTFVQEEYLSQGMEGASRPGHFRGVATVVAKLLNIVDPHVAVFGQKDYQQAAVVQRMAHDLNFPGRIIVAPTVRERDGLALSSRNKYLSPDERRQATALWQAIGLARRLVRSARTGLPAERLRKALGKFIAGHPAARIDYIAFFKPNTLRPVERVTRGIHLALAVWIGRTRLIDNARL